MTAIVSGVDDELVGRDEAFAALFAAHHRPALRLAYLLCGDTGRANEVVAEAFARVFVQWRRGRVADPGPYVRRAVVNQVNGGFRRLALERRDADRQRRERALLGTAFADQLADRDALRRALQGLTDRQRTAVVLRFYEDLPEAEVAAAMGVPVGTVKSTVSRGLERLRLLLADDEGAR